MNTYITTEAVNPQAQATLYAIRVKTIDHQEIPLSIYQGKVLLIVNVASHCGFTQQYEGLEKLQATYHDRGFEVLGFPCNQFGSQEPGSEEEIKKFCTLKFGVKFPLFEKIEVNGANAHPLYQFLTQEKAGFLGTTAIKWNFTKFLIDRHGNPVERFASTTEPASIAKKIEALL